MIVPTRAVRAQGLSLAGADMTFVQVLLVLSFSEQGEAMWVVIVVGEEGEAME